MTTLSVPCAIVARQRKSFPLVILGLELLEQKGHSSKVLSITFILFLFYFIHFKLFKRNKSL